MIVKRIMIVTSNTTELAVMIFAQSSSGYFSEL